MYINKRIMAIKCKNLLQVISIVILLVNELSAMQNNITDNTSNISKDSNQSNLNSVGEFVIFSSMIRVGFIVKQCEIMSMNH